MKRSLWSKFWCAVLFHPLYRVTDGPGNYLWHYCPRCGYRAKKEMITISLKQGLPGVLKVGEKYRTRIGLAAEITHERANFYGYGGVLEDGSQCNWTARGNHDVYEREHPLDLMQNPKETQP